jgi:hypothetical protein
MVGHHDGQLKWRKWLFVIFPNKTKTENKDRSLQESVLTNKQGTELSAKSLLGQNKLKH